MSLTSYRAAPPRAGMSPTVPAPLLPRYRPRQGRRDKGGVTRNAANIFVNGFFNLLFAFAIMPGDDLLFQRLSVSTIGAVRFHGRVRDGIGWGTDAMITKQYGGRKFGVCF
jgi:hypothetical protein